MAKTDPKTALERVLQHVAPLPSEPVPLDTALGRTLARELKADRDSPPTNRAAMDGYAVRAQDLAAPNGRLRLIGEVAAGASLLPRVRSGTCVRIFTGAVVPPGADAVVMVEETCEEQGEVCFRRGVRVGQHLRRRGEEYGKGDSLLPPGTLLGPAQIGLCAAVGRSTVRVYRQPRVAVLSTGTELVGVGHKVKPWQLHNSNGPMLRAAVLQAGARCVDQQDVPDESDTLLHQLRALASRADMVILSGGVSVGRYDLVPEAVKRWRGTIHFHGVSMKPGKPILFATRGRTCSLFGLPGNPVSALTGFYEFVLPALRRLSGFPLDRCQPAWNLPTGDALPVHVQRTLCTLVRLEEQNTGPTVAPVPSCGSAHLAAAALAEGVAVLPPGPEPPAAGSHVVYRPWRHMW